MDDKKADASNGKNSGNNTFVPDVIKEYLHLTASAVKIKFPHIQTFSSQQLINQAKSLPFFQFHDYMVRIMEKEEHKIKAQQTSAQSNHNSFPTDSKTQPDSETQPGPKPTKPFLSLFEKLFSNDNNGKEPSNKIHTTSNTKKLPNNATNNVNNDNKTQHTHGISDHANNRRLKGL